MNARSVSSAFAEDDLLPLSALQHLLFCERQCALIHVEGLWAENRLTAEGRVLHAKAHDGPDELRDGVQITRGISLRSLRLGLIGKADVVEWHPRGGTAVPYPVEYKRGKPKEHSADLVQLCAQALCLEEMCGIGIPEGALFYGANRRRLVVSLDAALRQLTESTAQRLHALVRAGITPTARREPKCDACSLLELCLPDVTGSRCSASGYVATALAASLTGPPPEDADV